MAVGELISRHVVRRLPDGQLPLGTTARKQGRVAGENALGGNREFAGSLGTRMVKIFDGPPGPGCVTMKPRRPGSTRSPLPRGR